MIRLGIRDNRTAFNPGEVLDGAVLWELPAAPKSAELRLVWSTRGKGTEDAATVEVVEFSNPQAGDTRPFHITLPEGPYSFNGRLISLIWALELVLKPGNEFVRTEIFIGPEGKEVTVSQIEPQRKSWKKT